MFHGSLTRLLWAGACGAMLFTAPALGEEQPPAQVAFCTAVDTGRIAYEKAGAEKNDIRRKEAREAAVTARRAALQPILASGEISGWIGTLRDITKLGSGRAYVSVKLPCRARLDTIDKTAVPPDSPMFAVLKDLSAGDQVRFSGELVRSTRDPEEWYEQSFLESSAMSDPNYAFRFTSIEPLGAK